MQFEGGRKDVSSVAVLTDLENIKIKQKQQEERIRHPDSVWLFKWKEVNRILEEYIYIQRLCVVFLSSFKINRIAGRFFVKKILLGRLPTVYCSLFNFKSILPFRSLCERWKRTRQKNWDTKDSSLGINFILGSRDQTQPGSLSLSRSVGMGRREP